MLTCHAGPPEGAGQWLQQRRNDGCAQSGHPGKPGATQQHTDGARVSVRRDCEHGVLLRLEEERPSLAGNMGFPVWDAPPRTAKRLGSAPGGAHRKKAQGPCGQGLRSMPMSASARSDGIHGMQVATRPEGRAAGHTDQPDGGTEHSAMRMAGPDRGRGSTRQVTTATPAKLDFRASRPADEGCADAMSAKSTASVERTPSCFNDPKRCAA